VKRYVIEFANDLLRMDRNAKLMKPCYWKDRKSKIGRIVQVYKSGLITECEAMRLLADV